MADDALFEAEPQPPPNGVCSVCGDEQPLRKDGRVRAHVAAVKAAQKPLCEGSREIPVAAPTRGGEEE